MTKFYAAASRLAVLLSILAISAPAHALSSSSGNDLLIAAKEPVSTTLNSNLRLTPILSLTGTTQIQDTSTSTDQTLTPAAQTVVDQSVAAGRLPTEEQLKKFPPDMRVKIIAEVERQLLAKQQTQQNPDILHNIFSDYGLQILALVISLFGVILAVSGFSIANSKKKKHIAKFMNEIDDAFNSFKWKSKRCEAELYRLHDMIEEKLKEGKLDESSYQLLSARIEKYLKEIQDADGVPNNIKYAALAEEQNRMKDGVKAAKKYPHNKEEEFGGDEESAEEGDK